MTNRAIFLAMANMALEVGMWVSALPVVLRISVIFGSLAAITVLAWGVWRWLTGNLIRRISWLVLLVLVAMLVQSFLDDQSTSKDRLTLLGAILIAAVLAQAGNDLLSRLKKAGPCEFVDKRAKELSHEIKEEFPPTYRYADLPLSPDEFPPKLLYEYREADRHISYLEATGLDAETARSEKLHTLLFKMSFVALLKGDWMPAAERLELLLRISEGKHKPAETHFRCGLAYRLLAQHSRNKEDREGYFLQAQDHFRKAVKEDPHHWDAFFNLAYVQFDLMRYELARQNNEKVVEIRPHFAPAKYNGAICHVMLEEPEKALTKLKSIQPWDENVKEVMDTVWTDEEIAPLLRDPHLGPEARGFLRSFREASVPGPKDRASYSLVARFRGAHRSSS